MTAVLLAGCASSDEGLSVAAIQDLNPFAEKQVPLPGKRVAVLPRDNKVGELASAERPIVLPQEHSNDSWSQPGGSANNAPGHLVAPAAMKTAWTANAPLPGGDIPNADFEGFLAAFRRSAPWLPEALARRYARAYGTRVDRLLAGARSLADLGEDFGGGLYDAEIDYLISQEWARTAEDILWRRSKLGLHVPDSTAQRLAARLARSA